MSEERDAPAFPQPMAAMPTGEMYCSCEKHPDFGGMTLRDYFAAKAMAAVWRDVPDDVNREQALEYLGKSCYEMADALLSARKEGE